MHRESKISVNLVPGAFPLKKWVGREKALAWLVTCLH